MLVYPSCHQSFLVVHLSIQVVFVNHTVQLKRRMINKVKNHAETRPDRSMEFEVKRVGTSLDGQVLTHHMSKCPSTFLQGWWE